MLRCLEKILTRNRRFLRGSAIFFVFALFFLVSSSFAKQKEKKFSSDPSSSIYRETQISFRNVVSARSFNKSADLTYNPYYAMELDFTLAFWPSSRFMLMLNTVFLREITNADDTTKRGEVQAEDVFLEASLKKLKQIPVLGIEFVPSARLYVPSSRISQGRTMILGIRPELLLKKHFGVLHGLTIFYSFWIRKDFHESTTSISETPLIDSSIGATRSEDSFSNMGIRNVSFAISNSLELSLLFSNIFGAKISFAFRHAFLYPIEYIDSRISYEPQTETNTRYQMFYQGEFFGRFGSAWTVAIGFLTENYQLAQDSTYESPFFNRYTAVYLDVRLDIAGLALQLSSKRGKK